ncbi:MAG: glycosyltransferase family 4 protein [Opitutae bacterium]|nr:glycosyltransferase family 4 protein [Opitutae bacterium]MBT6851568.1 glycosyltransferase family 4 protein [Opitutae bacterium]
MKASVANVVFNEFRNDARVGKISRSLAAAGGSVTVFATEGEGLPAAEERDGYRVFRPSSASRPVSRGRRVRSAFRTCLSLLRQRTEFDVIHCNDLEPLFFAVLAKWLTRGRLKVVYDAHELETEKHAVRGFRKLVSRWLERWLARRVDACVTVSPSIADWYRDAYGMDLPKVVLNCPPLREVRETVALRRSLGIDDGVRIVLLQGGFSPGRGLPELLEAFEGETAPENCALVFLGFGALHEAGRKLERLVVRAAEERPNVYFHPAVPQRELLELTASADIGVCFTEDMCLSHRYSLPNKLFEYAMTSLPMVVSDLREMRRMVERYDCGVVCEHLSAAGIRAALDSLFSKDLAVLGGNARRLAEEHCWEKQEKKLIELYQSLLKVA